MEKIELLLQIQKSLGIIINFCELEYRKGTPMISDKEFDDFFNLLGHFEDLAREEHKKFEAYKKRRTDV